MDKDELIRGLVKPLIWESGLFCDQDAFYSAYPNPGWSVVQFSSRNGRWAVDDPFGNASDDDWETASEAKAAAEADYRARIAAALDLDKLRALVEAGKNAIVAMQESRGVIVSKREHAVLTEAVADLRAALAAFRGDA